MYYPAITCPTWPTYPASVGAYQTYVTSIPTVRSQPVAAPKAPTLAADVFTPKSFRRVSAYVVQRMHFPMPVRGDGSTADKDGMPANPRKELDLEITPNGNVTQVNGGLFGTKPTPLGRIGADGNIYGPWGKRMGRVDEEGHVFRNRLFSDDEKCVAHVAPNGQVTTHGPVVRSLGWLDAPGLNRSEKAGLALLTKVAY